VGLPTSVSCGIIRCANLSKTILHHFYRKDAHPIKKRQFGWVNLTSSPHYFEGNDVRSTQTHTVRYMQYMGNNRFGRNRYRLSTFLYRHRNIIEHNEWKMNCSNTSFPGYFKRVTSSFKNEIATKWFSRKLAHVAFLRLIPYSLSTVWQYYVQGKVTLRSRI
jgi:hypothetical protein